MFMEKKKTKTKIKNQIKTNQTKQTGKRGESREKEKLYESVNHS